MSSYVGIDACKAGWIAIALDDEVQVTAAFLPSLDTLGEQLPHAAGVAIDIPLGLPARDRRQADVEARAMLGPRRSSIFSTPVREAAVQPTYSEANARSKALTGRGISAQAFALAPKILEAERWSLEARVPVWEVHPEVSFTLLMGAPARAPKTSWAGVRQRLRALEDAGVAVDDLGAAGERAKVDDVVDAAVAAWSARRLAHGRGRTWPDPPERDPITGQEMAIRA